MEYKAYQHIEKFGREECEGIDKGKVYIQPKIDGTNSCVWIKDGIIHAGSRKRELNQHDDNAGFYNTIIKDNSIQEYLLDHKNQILYGEWLVPHTIKYYNDDAWKKFYIFDVFEYDEIANTGNYVPYDLYSKELDKYNIKYIPCLAIIDNPTLDDFKQQLELNKYLLCNKSNIGEGIVIKNYDYHNKYGRQTWAKIVAEEFFNNKKDLRSKNHDLKINNDFEIKITNEYITDSIIYKEYAKVIDEYKNANQNEKIGRVLSNVYNSFIDEDLLTVVRKNKNCSINFNYLKKCSNNRVKEVLKNELF